MYRILVQAIFSFHFQMENWLWNGERITKTKNYKVKHNFNIQNILRIPNTEV